MGKSIMIIDDEVDVTRVLQFRLEANGFQTSCQNSSAEAYEKLQSEVFDVILMDYFMPSLKGDELCRMLRESERYKKTPIFVMTAFSDRSEDFFKEQGATGVFYKPLEFDEMLSKIQASVGL